MSRAIHKLSAAKVKAVSEPGRHGDGGGLYLVVDKRNGGKRWVFLHRGRELGLGPLRDVTLAEARAKAETCRKVILAGGDPLATRRAMAAPRLFGDYADAYVGRLQLARATMAGWRKAAAVHAGDLRALRIDHVDTAHVAAMLRPYWESRPDMGRRLRAKVETILDAATVEGLRSGPNPARWSGHLEHLLPQMPRLTRGHQRALPWQSVPATYARIRALGSISAMALEWAILTGMRTGEVIGTPKRGEIAGDVWEVPGPRMKMRAAHRVPLPPRCLEIAAELSGTPGKWLFPGPQYRNHLSRSAMYEVIKGIGNPCTVHGFRSSFRDWAEDNGFDHRLAELALAHNVGSSVERAYRRGDGFERRRVMMAAWAEFATEGELR